jgi:lambda family phage portal protein
LNPLDRVIGFFSPTTALKRERARMALRVYEGAQVGRRTSSFRGHFGSANVEIWQAIRPLRERSRELVRNTPHAPRMIDVLVNNAIGIGLRPVPRTGSDRIDNQVIDLWEEWQKEADIEGRLGFDAMQALALRSTVESGEVVLRMIDRKPDKVACSPVPLRVQLLEADFIDEYRDGYYAREGTGLTPQTLRSRLGIGLGEFDLRTGLWLWPWHPGELLYTTRGPGMGFKSFMSSFYTMAHTQGGDVLHIFRELRPGQVRGVPWFAPILTTARDHADFVDAVRVKARVEACFAGFIVNPDDLEPLVDITTEGPATNTSVSNPNLDVTTLEPGMLKTLRSGQDIKFAQPTTNTQIDTMVLFDLMAMAAGVGVTYDQLSGDLRQANYSSLRAGKLDFRRLIEQVQFHMLIPQLCQPVWDRFIARAILAGALRERAKGYPCNWVTPAWEPINPKIDLDAEQHEVRSGRVSPQEYIAGKGSDWRKVQDDFKEFFDRADKLKLVFDIDVRHTTRTGVAQKAGLPAGADEQQANGKTNGEGFDTSQFEAGTVFDADGNPIEMKDNGDGDEADATD